MINFDLDFQETSNSFKTDFVEKIFQGDSAYQIAVKNGFIGTELEWLESLKGKDGAAAIDNTLTVEGAAADAKVTGEIIKEIKDGTLTTEYYAVEFVKMVQDGLGEGIVYTELINNTVTLTAAGILTLAIFENNIQHKIVDAPFDFMYVNGPIWNNKHQFKRVGITSPVITQQFGVNDILWFDTTIPRIMEHFGASEDSYELFFDDKSARGTTEGIILIGFIIEFGIQQIASQVKDLWKLILSNPETKLIFEYKNQENIPVIEAPYAYDAAPIDIGGLNNEN